jgi:hypothetical protein
METEDLLKCSQEPATGFYPQPDQSNPSYPNIILPRTSKSS